MNTYSLLTSTLDAIVSEIILNNGSFNFEIQGEDEIFVNVEGSIEIESEYDEENDYDNILSCDITIDNVVIEECDEDGNITRYEITSEDKKYIYDEVERICA